MKRRLTSWLLTLAMLLSLVPAMGVTASAAETRETVTTYEQFEAAMTAEGQRNVKLGADIDTAELNYDIGLLDTLAVKGQKQLDLNGHTLRLFTQKSALGDLIEVKTSSLTLSDSSAAQTGRILGVTKGDANVLINVWENGKFTMNSGKLEVEVYTGSLRGVLWRRTIDCHYGGEVVINGGTLYVPPETYEDRNAYTTQFFDEFDDLHNGSCGYTLITNNNSKVTINGGTFQGPVRMNAGNSKWNKTTSRVIITGGTFEKDVVLNGAGSTTGDGKVTLAEIKGGTFLGKVQAWAAASFESSFSTPEVVISGGDFSKEFWLRPKFPLVNNKEQRGVAYQVAAKLNGGTFHEGFSADKNYENYEYSASAVKQRLEAYEIYQLADKLLGQNAIQTGNGTFAAQDNNSYNKYITNYRKSEHDSGGYAFIIMAVKGQPTTIIPNAWGMKSVTLDGKKINYAKDWKGAVENLTNDKAHTLKFEWNPLASELVNAGYTYRTTCEHYISGSTAVQQTDTIAADKTSHTVTIPAGADPKVYSYDLQLNLQKDGSNIGIFTNDHIVKLVVNEAPPAPPEPPAPVAHSITVTNGRGTANPTSATAGETVTVTAKDDTANDMMFTQWYTDTPGVTFKDATQQETTFVMPDCDVKVNPGFQQVSFRKQPLDSWPQVNHGSKATVTFSAPITKWELQEDGDTVASSGSLFINTGNPITVDIPAQSSEVEKTYTVVVTANGQKFSSNEFKVKWVSWPKAPEVEFTPADGTQFVREIEVIASDALYAGDRMFDIVYTINGDDPKDNTAAIDANEDTEHIKLKDTATIRARTHNPEATEEDAKWGPLATATFTKYSDTTLPKPTITPESMTYTGSITAYLTAPALDGVKMEYCLMQTGDPNTIGSWATYDPETGITVNEFGTITLYARSFKNVDAETSEGLGYVEHLTSENVSATYTRTYSAAIDDVTVSGEVGKTLTQDVVIRMNGDRFENITAGEDVSGWFNLPAGLTAKVKALSEVDGYHKNLTVTISGTPTADSVNTITVTIPKEKLYANNAADLTVLSNPKAYYSISTEAVHTHDYTGQPYLYLDPGNHYQECKAGDGYNILAHAFTPWTDNGNDTHSHHCTVCKMVDGSTYTETANHNWQWVVDTHATSTTAGKQHEECPDCHARRSENTVIPATGGGSSSGGGGGGGSAATPPASDKAAKELKNAKEGSTVTIDMKGETKLPASVTKEIAGKDVTVELDMGGGMVWSFSGLDVPKGGVSLDLGVKTGTKTIPAKVIHALTGEVTTVQLQLNHNGPFGMSLKLSVDLGKKHDGLYANLYFYNPKRSALEFQSASMIRGGKASWAFDHASDYAIVIDKESHEPMTFTDVPAGSYYEDAVVWAVDKGITTGTSATTFHPNGICTRAQIVTFLWRAAGSPEPKAMSTFVDVSADAYYAKAVAWAVENGITGGTGDGKFSPDAACTRAQAVTFLWRANGSPAVSGNAAFRDVAANAYYAAAVTWAEKNGITGGIGGGLFGSDHNCTRAQIVTFLYSSMK